MLKSFKIVVAALALLVVSQLASADPFKLTASATSITPPVFDNNGHMFPTASGSGSAMHMGNFTFVAPHDFNLINGTYVSDAFVKASNGDILHIVSLGQFINSVDSVATWTIVGGTGRFSNATGTGTGVNLNFGASITFTGTIFGVE